MCCSSVVQLDGVISQNIWITGHEGGAIKYICAHWSRLLRIAMLHLHHSQPVLPTYIGMIYSIRGLIIPNYILRGHVTVQTLEMPLMVVIQNLLIVFLKEIVICISKPDLHTASLEQLWSTLEQVEELGAIADTLHVEVLQAHSICYSLQKVGVTQRRIFVVIYAMEDVSLHAMAVNIATLIEMHHRSELVYQTGSDVIPLANWTWTQRWCGSG